MTTLQFLCGLFLLLLCFASVWPIFGCLIWSISIRKVWRQMLVVVALDFAAAWMAASMFSFDDRAVYWVIITPVFGMALGYIAGLLHPIFMGKD